MANACVRIHLQELLQIVNLKKKDLEKKSIELGLDIKNGTRSAFLAAVLASYVEQPVRDVPENQKKRACSKQSKLSWTPCYRLARRHTLTTLDTNLPLVLAFMTTKEICLFCRVSKVCKEVGYSSWNYGSIICEGLSAKAVRSVFSRLLGVQRVLHLSLWRVKDPTPIDLDAINVVDASNLSRASPKRWIHDVAVQGCLQDLKTLDFQGCTWVDCEFLAVLSKFCPKLQYVDARDTGLGSEPHVMWTFWPRLQCFEIRPSLWRELFLAGYPRRGPTSLVAPPSDLHELVDTQTGKVCNLIAFTSRHEQPGWVTDRLRSGLQFPALRKLTVQGGEESITITEERFPSLQACSVTCSATCSINIDSQTLRKLGVFTPKCGTSSISRLNAPHLEVFELTSAMTKSQGYNPPTDEHVVTTQQFWNDFLQIALDLKVVCINTLMSFRTDAATTATTLQNIAKLPSLRLLRFRGIPQAPVTLQFQSSLAVLLWSHKAYYAWDLVGRECQSDPFWDFRGCSKLTWAHLAVASTGVESIAASLVSLTAASSSLAYLKVSTCTDDTHKIPLELVKVGVLEVLSMPYGEITSIVTFLQKAKASSTCRLTWLEVEDCPGVENNNSFRAHSSRNRNKEGGFLELLDALAEVLSDSGFESFRGLMCGQLCLVARLRKPTT